MADHDSTDDVSSVCVVAQPMAAGPPNSAATKVFGVVELAEQILMELKTEDLFRAQRVCRQWKAVIESSSPCRKALFLEPGNAEDVNVDDDHRFVMQWWQRDIETFGRKELAACKNGIMFNPLLVKQLANHPKDIYARPALSDPRRTSSLYPKLLSACENASCERMLISQPPLQFMTSGIDLARKPRYKSKQKKKNAASTITQTTSTSTEFVTAGNNPFVERRELGRGTTLGELRHNLRANLKEYKRICPNALWTFSWVGSRSLRPECAVVAQREESKRI